MCVAQFAVQDRLLNGIKIGSWIVREKMVKHKGGFARDVLPKPRSRSSDSFSDVVGRACDTGDRVYTNLVKQSSLKPEERQ